MKYIWTNIPIMIRLFRIPTIFLSLLLIFTSCHKQVKEKDSIVSFRTVELKEIHHLKDDVKNPVLSIELKFQYPTAYADDSILKKIQKAMLTDFFPDMEDTTSQPESAMKSYVNGKIKLYESSDDLLTDEDEQTPSTEPEVAWKDNTILLIRHNADNLLSYTVQSTTQFSGGAHGGTTFRNSIINLKTGEKIREEDLFTEESLPLINAIILKKLEFQNKVQTPEELEQIGYFDVTQIDQYKNFYLSQVGLVYTFNQYEIGAYTLGTIEVTLTFKDIEGFISPGSPLEKLIR